MTRHTVIKTRFIAGAVCPDCQVLDRIVVETATLVQESELHYRRRCVACGFQDEFSSQPVHGHHGLPRGRVERPARVSDDAAQVPVQILDPRRTKPGDS